MPILPRTVTSPKKFIIGHDLLPQLHDHVKDFGDNALLVSDEFILERVREEALAGLLQAGLKGGSRSSTTSVPTSRSIAS